MMFESNDLYAPGMYHILVQFDIHSNINDNTFSWIEDLLCSAKYSLTYISCNLGTYGPKNHYVLAEDEICHPAFVNGCCNRMKTMILFMFNKELERVQLWYN